MIIFLYAVTVAFSLIFSFFVYNFEREHVKHQMKDKLVHVVMPFIPFLNIMWIVYKML
jgi:hypothetical protein